MSIGDRIKQARLALGYSAEQVAAFLHVSPATIYRYENGDISKLPTKHLKPLAEYLCVTPEYLMGWTDDSPAASDDPQIRIVSGMMENMTKEQKDQIVAIVRAVIGHPANYERTDTDDHKTRL